MAKKDQQKPAASQSRRPERAKLSSKESLKRLREFAKRKEQFVATVRTGKSRGVSA